MLSVWSCNDQNNSLYVYFDSELPMNRNTITFLSLLLIMMCTVGIENGSAADPKASEAPADAPTESMCEVPVLYEWIPAPVPPQLGEKAPPAEAAAKEPVKVEIYRVSKHGPKEDAVKATLKAEEGMHTLK